MRFFATRESVLLGLLILANGALADEEKVPLSDVPKAVLDAVRARFPEGKMKGAEKEVEKGKVTYEIALTDKGSNLEVGLKADGTITEIEKEIAVADLPKAVVDAVNAKYPAGTIKEAELVIEFEDGKEEKSYEVVVVKADKKKVEVEVSPEGKIEEEEQD